MHESGDSHKHLTTEERERLRPGVDASALEEFMARMPASERMHILVSFVTVPTEAEVRAILTAQSAAGDPFSAELLHRIGFATTASR